MFDGSRAIHITLLTEPVGKKRRRIPQPSGWDPQPDGCGLQIGHSAKLFSATPEELNVCRTEATQRRTPAGCYVPVLTSGSRGYIAPLRGATLRRTFSTNIAHLRCA